MEHEFMFCQLLFPKLRNNCTFVLGWERESNLNSRLTYWYFSGAFDHKCGSLRQITYFILLQILVWGSKRIKFTAELSPWACSLSYQPIFLLSLAPPLVTWLTNQSLAVKFICALSICSHPALISAENPHNPPPPLHCLNQGAVHLHLNLQPEPPPQKASSPYQGQCLGPGGKSSLDAGFTSIDLFCKLN